MERKMDHLSWVLMLAAGGFAGIAFWLFCWRRSGGKRNFSKREPGVPDQPVVYNIQSKGAPTLPGNVAKVVFNLVDSTVGRATGLKDQINRMANVIIFRDILMEDTPTFYPLIRWEGRTAGKESGPLDLDALLKRGDKRPKSDFRFKGISDFYEGYRSGKFTPSDVAEKAIAAIERSDRVEPKLRAFVECNPEEIRKAATASTQRFANGRPLSVFDGIPIGVKDEIRVASHHLRFGSTFLGHSLSEKDSEPIRRLRAKGAIILGVTNMQENGMGTTGINISKYHGTPRNPYNVNHFTGGSSSGSAAAVAAGLCPVALGTDGGGSVRIPATLCGVVGLKPTFGRVSWSGSPVPFSSVGAKGPLCTSVRDAAITYALMSGLSPNDDFPMDPPAVELTGFDEPDLKGFRLGIYWDFFQHADQEIVNCCKKAVDYLKSRGAEVVSIQIPELEEARVAHILTILSEMRSNLQESFWNQFEEHYFENATLLSMIESMTITDFIQAQQQKTRTISFLKDIFQKVDVILNPGCAILAPKINPAYLKQGFTNTKMTSDIMRHAFLANFAGTPALTVPVGYSIQGLPISLQVMGAWWQESTVLRVGRIVEEFLEQVLQPKVHFDILD